MDYLHFPADWRVWVAVAVIAVIWLFSSFFVVREQSAAVIQRFGKFARIAHSGLNFKLPLIEDVYGHVSLRVNQLAVQVETKTEDNVFVHLMVSVQYRVKQDKVYAAFYKLQDSGAQITSYVYDVVRARAAHEARRCLQEEGRDRRRHRE
jgi:regulator of protease activity HflC (stomatin/prohibitin superfamily)